MKHDGNSLDSGHYCSNLFYVHVVIWWHCYDDEITKIGDFPEGVYTRDSHKNCITKKRFMSGSDKILLVVFIRTNNLIASRSVFDKEFSDMSNINHIKYIMKYLGIFRIKFSYRRDVSD